MAEDFGADAASTEDAAMDAEETEAEGVVDSFSEADDGVSWLEETDGLEMCSFSFGAAFCNLFWLNTPIINAPPSRVAAKRVSQKTGKMRSSFLGGSWASIASHRPSLTGGLWWYSLSRNI